MKKTLIIALAVLSCTAISQATEYLRLEGSTDLTDGTYWTTNGVDVGVIPSGADVALFSSESLSDTNGITYGSTTVSYAGLKFTDIAGPITFPGIVYFNSNLGIIASNATQRINFSHWRCSTYSGLGPVVIGPDCTLAFDTISGSKHAYVISISGGGNMIVNGTASGGGTRMMFNVSGTNTTIGGTGNWAPSVVNVTYPMYLDSGTIIAPGDNGIGTMTITDSDDSHVGLYLSDGTTMKMELGTGGNAFALPSTDSDQLVLADMDAGDVVFAGTTTIDLQGTGTNGVYKLIETSLDATTWSGLTVSNEVFNWSGNLVTNQVITGGLVATNFGGIDSYTLIMGDGTNGDPGDIYLLVGELDLPYNPSDVYWATESGAWDINNSLNWSNSSDIAVYYEKDGTGDSVTFDDKAPGSIHSISLNTVVYPSGVTIDSTNDYSFSGTGSINGNIALNKAGSGMLTMSMANAYEGGTTIAGGIVKPQVGSALGTGGVTFEGGTLQSGANYVNFDNPMFADAGQSGTLIMSDRCEINQPLTGSGTFNVVAPSTLGGTRDYLDAPCAGFNGTLNISGGGRLELRANGASFDGNLSGTTVSLDNEQLYTRNWSFGLTVQLGSLSGTSSALLGGDTVGGATTWEIGSKNLDTEFAGIIQNGTANATALSKVGTGSLELSGTNTYTGATTIQDGTLVISGAIVSAPTVNGGTLNVSGSVTNDITVNGGKLIVGTAANVSNVTVNAGGTIAGGNEGFGGAGAINGNLDMADGAMIEFNTNGVDILWISGSLNITNTFGADDVVVEGNDWSGVPNGQYILLWGYTNTIADIDTSESYIGNGRSATLEDAFGILLLNIDAASAVPDIGNATVSGGSITLEWDTGSYNVYTNDNLANTNGWGVATNGASPLVLPISEESQLFYKIGN